MESFLTPDIIRDIPTSEYLQIEKIFNEMYYDFIKNIYNIKNQHKISSEQYIQYPFHEKDFLENLNPSDKSNNFDIFQYKEFVKVNQDILKEYKNKCSDYLKNLEDFDNSLRELNQKSDNIFENNEKILAEIVNDVTQKELQERSSEEAAALQKSLAIAEKAMATAEAVRARAAENKKKAEEALRTAKTNSVTPNAKGETSTAREDIQAAVARGAGKAAEGEEEAAKKVVEAKANVERLKKELKDAEHAQNTVNRRKMPAPA